MRSQEGFALISALLLLGFLALVGGALLTTATVDVRIGENYRTSAQLLLLAEAGIEEARERLRTTPNDLSTDLAAAAGADGVLSDSRDWDALLMGADDQPLIPEDPADRASGLSFVDPTGRTLGQYWVFLRNDPADGVTATADTNSVLTLVSIARIGNRMRVVEADVKRGGWGELGAALTLNGPVDVFAAADTNVFHVDGRDVCLASGDRHAIGVIDPDDLIQVIDEIPASEQANYTGIDPFPDIEDLEAWLPGRMKTTAGLEDLIGRFAVNATDVYDPPFGSPAGFGDIGGPSDPRVVLVNGDLNFGPGAGYGVLIVRGRFQGVGAFSWNGLVLIVGQGQLLWSVGATGEVNGAIVVARTRGAADAGNPLGDLLADRGPVHVDFNGGGGNGVFYNSCALAEAYRTLPYSPIAIREY